MRSTQITRSRDHEITKSQTHKITRSRTKHQNWCRLTTSMFSNSENTMSIAPSAMRSSSNWRNAICVLNSRVRAPGSTAVTFSANTNSVRSRCAMRLRCRSLNSLGISAPITSASSSTPSSARPAWGTRGASR